jgi:hypothetical protein
VLGKSRTEYFVIHDIRRSTRTIMSKNKVRREVAEKAIGHVKKGVEGIYNRDAFLRNGSRRMGLWRNWLEGLFRIFIV